MGMYGYIWVCMDMYGYVWVCMSIYGYVRVFKGMYVYIWICMGICGIWVCILLNVTIVYFTVLYYIVL